MPKLLPVFCKLLPSDTGVFGQTPANASIIMRMQNEDDGANKSYRQSMTAFSATPKSSRRRLPTRLLIGTHARRCNAAYDSFDAVLQITPMPRKVAIVGLWQYVALISAAAISKPRHDAMPPRQKNAQIPKTKLRSDNDYPAIRHERLPLQH